MKKMIADDWTVLDTESEYIDSFNETFSGNGWKAVKCEVKETYTDRNGNDLAHVVFYFEEV